MINAVADGARHAGTCSRSKARLTFSAQGQRAAMQCKIRPLMVTTTRNS